MTKRLFWIVLDSLGIGHAPDAAAFGDEGSHTLKSACSDPVCKLPNLQKLGLFNVEGADCGEAVAAPTAAFGRLTERSGGKDTTSGHWEMAGCPVDFDWGYCGPCVRNAVPHLSRRVSARGD